MLPPNHYIFQDLLVLYARYRASFHRIHAESNVSQSLQLLIVIVDCSGVAIERWSHESTLYSSVRFIVLFTLVHHWLCRTFSWTVLWYDAKPDTDVFGQISVTFSRHNQHSVGPQKELTHRVDATTAVDVGTVVLLGNAHFNHCSCN